MWLAGGSSTGGQELPATLSCLCQGQAAGTHTTFVGMLLRLASVQPRGCGLARWHTHDAQVPWHAAVEGRWGDLCFGHCQQHRIPWPWCPW